MNPIDSISPTTTALDSMSAEMAWHYRCIPVSLENGTLSILVEGSREVDVANELEALLGLTVEASSLEKDGLTALLGRHYRRSAAATASEISVRGGDPLDRIIQDARSAGSSDIHFEVYEDRARVRIRIDGMLVERFRMDRSDHPEMVNRIKIRSNLDITEKRLPQDGRIKYGEFDVRVSVLPTLHGEKVVMRILGHDAASIDLEKLGMSDQERRFYLEGIKKPNGIVLISGPTGSGKTTTLYATLKLLNEEKRNVVTVEDPIEYTLEGINQVQLKEDIGLTFAAALRSFLRQDPDVIMLGEIRDGETAQMAIRAALTGHLVLSTIHTNSAWGTVSRLIDMGVPPFLISNTLNTSVAQRLVRVLCPDCKREEPLTPEDLPVGFRSKDNLSHHYVPVGCTSCFHTGYRGRRAIYEVIPMDMELAECVRKGASNVNQELKERNINKLSELAFKLLADGITSLEEVYGTLTNE